MENAATLIISIIILVLLIIVIVIIICCGGEKNKNNNNQNKNKFCTFFQGNSALCCGVPNDYGQYCHFTSKTDNGYVDVSYTVIFVNNYCKQNW